MKKFLFLFFFLFYLNGFAQNFNDNKTIIPSPNLYKATGDSITLNGQIKVVFENNKYSAKELKTAQIFETAVNQNLPVKKSPIEVLFISKNSPISKEAYKISISSKKIIVTGSEEGLFYAVQSLLQLLPNKPSNKKKIKLPCITVEDLPRYAYRGLHLDVCRHLFSVDVIKYFITKTHRHK